MSFLYFAYGSNLWVPQMRSRCPSARPVTTDVLEGWSVGYDKPSTDGSSKLNIRPDAASTVPGVIYEIDDGERQALAESEPRYRPMGVDIRNRRVLTYTYEGEPHRERPYDWYVAVSVLGASSHGLPTDHLDVESIPDPLAPAIRPATLGDTHLIQDILSDGLTAKTDRYYAHPGEFTWWVYHDDPRHPDHFSTWIQGEDGFVVIDAVSPTEINLFTRPGVDRMPLLRWAQRRLRDGGEVGWVDDGDAELTSALTAGGYEGVDVNRNYRWDLTTAVPSVELPSGWELRAVTGEEEANSRRAASHHAFESTMPDAMHLQRYLDFMRSPAYVPERDLVAVSPDGRVASFMVWWADRSGIAQIEPFGTHPEFHRQGVGRALIYFGLHRMKAAGMHTCRVITDDGRDAVHFYEGVGFEDVGRVRWWKRQ